MHPSDQRAMSPTQENATCPVQAAGRTEAAKGRSKSEKRRSTAGFASPPTKSHSSPISTFDGTMTEFSDVAIRRFSGYETYVDECRQTNDFDMRPPWNRPAPGSTTKAGGVVK